MTSLHITLNSEELKTYQTDISEAQFGSKQKDSEVKEGITHDQHSLEHRGVNNSIQLSSTSTTFAGLKFAGT